jgi:hypothetical protein
MPESAWDVEEADQEQDLPPYKLSRHQRPVREEWHTKPKIIAIIRRLMAGEKYLSIAADFGVTEQRIYWIRKRAGLPDRLLRSRRKVTTAA